ncbi:glycosyltransferase family 2 protein, partial [Myxococcota bacterium]|nr:glycosyltransferase family 2 protein [Myxococcota bacterium]
GRNRGKGAALQTGLREALQRGYSHIITLDADGQHFPEDIPSMRDAALEDPTAIWTGARDLSDDNVQGASRFGRSFSNFWLRVQTGVKLVDSQSGFRVYPIAPVLSLGLRASAYDFEVEVLTLGARAGIPLRSKPIGVYYPPPDERVSHFDKLWDNVRISWVNTRLLIALPLWLLGWPHRLSKMQPPANVSRSWSGRSRGGAFGHLIFMLLIRWFGPTPGYWLLRPISFYFTLFFGHARRMSAAFLDVAQKPEHRFGYRFWRSYRHLLLFSQEILDRAVVQVRGAKDFSWTADGRDYLREVEGQGAILLSGHLGNYELGGAFLHSEKMRLSVVMLDNEAEMIKRVHARFSDTARLPNIISTNKGDFPSLEVLRVLRQGDTVALHGDRIVDQRFVLCDFMGKKAPFPTGVFMLAAAAKKPVILTFGFKTGPRTYHFIAEKPREIILPRKERQSALQEHAQWYASRLEFWAKTHPEQWFNFYDFFEIPTQTESEECE